MCRVLKVNTPSKRVYFTSLDPSSLTAGYVRAGFRYDGFNVNVYGYRLLFFSAAPRADELDLSRARVDLSFLDLPQLLLAHGLHLVRLRYLQRPESQTKRHGESGEETQQQRMQLVVAVAWGVIAPSTLCAAGTRQQRPPGILHIIGVHQTVPSAFAVYNKRDPPQYNKSVHARTYVPQFIEVSRTIANFLSASSPFF